MQVVPSSGIFFDALSEEVVVFRDGDGWRPNGMDETSGDPAFNRLSSGKPAAATRGEMCIVNDDDETSR